MNFEDKAKALLTTARMLQQYCSEIECKNCIFHIDGWCTIENVPQDWEIEAAERELER